MKKLIITLFFLFEIVVAGFSQNVGIGTNTPDSSAILDIVSQSKGLLIPRMDSNARNALPNTKGLMVYDSSSGSFWYNDGNDWCKTVSTKTNQQLVPNGNATGDLLYWNGTKWTQLPIGNEGDVLNVCHGLPHWGTCPPLPTSTTLVPDSSSYEGFISSLNPTVFESGDAHQLLISAWTYSGTFYVCRTCIRFDYSGIPAGATIDSAKLYLYANPVPIDGDKVDAMSGSTNSCYIQRITSPWTLPTPFNWNNPPATTTTNQAVIPQSVSAAETDSVNVTALVVDMLANGNNGFLIQLQNEVIYNIRQYASSYNSNPAIRPKLVIAYH